MGRLAEPRSASSRYPVTVDSTWIIWIAAAYLIGSIPFGVLLGRMRGVDIRQHGSRNVGATNVARLLGKKLGLTCFFLDMAKGAGPVVGAGVTTGVFARLPAEVTEGQMLLWLGVAIAAILGHMFSVFLRFGGGKGVATGFGSMLAMWPLLTLPALIAFVVWYATLRLTKYVGLASVAAVASLPLLVGVVSVAADAGKQGLAATLADLGHAWPLIAVTALLACVVTWKHRGNLARIRRGEEPKIGTGPRRTDAADERPPAS